MLKSKSVSSETSACESEATSNTLRYRCCDSGISCWGGQTLQRLLSVGQNLACSLKRLATLLIKIYQWFSRFTPAHCRFYPTCSEYTRQAIEKYGLLKGGWLGVKRICRCHPGNSGGYDPLP